MQRLSGCSLGPGIAGVGVVVRVRTRSMPCELSLYFSCCLCCSVNTGLHCLQCEYDGEPMLPQRDSVIFLLWLRNPLLEVTAAWAEATGQAVPDDGLYLEDAAAYPQHVSSPHVAATSAAADRVARGGGGSGSYATPGGHGRGYGRMSGTKSKAEADKMPIPNVSGILAYSRNRRRSSGTSVGNVPPDDYRRFEVLMDAIGQVGSCPCCRCGFGWGGGTANALMCCRGGAHWEATCH